MNKPRLLDAFCGAGGAGMGYHLAGFEVVGVDNRPMPRYPFEFHQADALEFISARGQEFDVIHASPPCQAYTLAQNAAKNTAAHPQLIEPVRKLLQQTGRLYVIENVIGAPLINPFKLCGLSFGLRVRRHRLFEANFFVLTSPCQCKNEDYYVIFGNEIRNRRHGERAGRKNNVAQGRIAMDIDWMTRAELSQAIPPAYTRWIGERLMEMIGTRALSEAE